MYDESFGIIPLSQTKGEWRVFLILHKPGKHWGFPKGHANPGENAQEAASRELHEETGLEVEKFLRETPLTEEYQFKRKGDLIRKKVSYFPALVKGKEKLQVEEIQEGKWVSLPEALRVLTFKEARSICEQLIKLL